MNYKALSAAGAPQYLQRRVLKDCELDDDVETLVALESVYARYSRIEAEKEIKKHRGRQ